MKIRDFASQFTVYVFATDIDHGAGFKVALSQAGYDSYFFETADNLLSRLTEKPPHVVVFPVAALRTQKMSDFVERCLKAVPELKFVVIAKPEQTESLATYNDFGVEDVLTPEPQGLSNRVVFAVDRVCERLYMTYQNEQLLESWEQDKKKWREAGAQAPAATAAGPTIDIEGRLKDYQSSGSKEDLLRKFTQYVSGIKCVYLKYLPMVRTLVMTHGTALSHPSQTEVGCPLKPEEAKDFSTQVTHGVVVPSLQAFLKTSFGIDSARLLPLFVAGQMEGVFAFASQISPEQRSLLSQEYALFSLAYSHFSLERRLDTLEVEDPVTGISNRKFYQARVLEEWTRARRLKQPLCVVKIAIDDFFEIEQTLGENTRDSLLKKLAQLIVQTSRTNDSSARTAMNEFAMILPHCSRQGAMIRAERLRRIIESTQMIENGLKVSISLGISEYPSLCSTVEALDESATKALAHIVNKGGNRLCLSKAPANHRPDFDVAVENTAP